VTQDNPYRSQARQYQRQGQQRQSSRQIRDGFDPELLDKDVETEVVKGMGVVVIRGKVVDVSKYWLKILTNGEVVHLNKAYIVSIKPLVVKDTAGDGNGRERASRPK